MALSKEEKKALLALLHELAFNAGNEHYQNKLKIRNTEADHTVHEHRTILEDFIDQNQRGIKCIIPDIQSGTHEECWMDTLYPAWRELAKPPKTRVMLDKGRQKAYKIGQKYINAFYKSVSKRSIPNREIYAR
eukprot:105654_1